MRQSSILTLLVLMIAWVPVLTAFIGVAHGTLVLTDKGLVPIEQLHAGNQVLSYDTVTDQTVLDTVVACFRWPMPWYARNAIPMVTVHCGSTSFIAHPKTCLYRPDSDRWTMAKELVSGDVVQTTKGPVLLDAVAHSSGACEFYCLQTRTYHNFFVTERALLVHNFIFAVPVLAYLAENFTVSFSLALYGICIQYANGNLTHRNPHMNAFEQYQRELRANEQYTIEVHPEHALTLECDPAQLVQTLQRLQSSASKKEHDDEAYRVTIDPPLKPSGCHGQPPAVPTKTITVPEKPAVEPTPFQAAPSAPTVLPHEQPPIESPLLSPQEADSIPVNPPPPIKLLPKELDIINEILEGAQWGRKTMGRTKQFEKPGTFEDALKDFEKMGLTDVRKIHDEKIMGILSDGRTVIVRVESNDERPTLEIQDTNKKNKIKIRYGEKPVAEVAHGRAMETVETGTRVSE
jgi:hypothetical protein